MGDKLKPGHFTPKGAGETNFDYSGFANSMAEKIEQELDALLAMDGLPALKHSASNAEVRDRRRLFVAIARGVVIHLRENEDAFTVPHTGASTLEVDIDTEEG